MDCNSGHNAPAYPVSKDTTNTNNASTGSSTSVKEDGERWIIAGAFGEGSVDVTGVDAGK